MEVNMISKQIQQELKKFSKEYAQKISQITEDVANSCVNELKLTSPSSDMPRRKKYASGWTVKLVYKDDENVRYKVKNKNAPQLTHLLEYGHAKVNGGRVEARPHIKKAEENAKENLLKKIKGRWLWKNYMTYYVN